MSNSLIPVSMLAASLRKAHSTLDRRVRELDRRAFLTPAEQRERTELKKKKLAIKDSLDRVSSAPPLP